MVAGALCAYYRRTCPAVQCNHSRPTGEPCCQSTNAELRPLQGRDVCNDAAFSTDQETFVKRDTANNRIGSTYKKAIFLEYTDDTFTTVKVRW